MRIHIRIDIYHNTATSMKQPYVPLPVQLPSEVSKMIIAMKMESEGYDAHRKRSKKMHKEHALRYNQMLIKKLDSLVYECEVCYENYVYCSPEDHDYYHEKMEIQANKLHDLQEINREKLLNIYHKATICKCDNKHSITHKPCTCDNVISSPYNIYPFNKSSCMCENQKNVIELASGWAQNLLSHA